MSITIREYTDADWPDLCRIHDVARLDELRPTVGLDAFLSLEQTFEEEGLFDGAIWVAELEGQIAGFIAVNDHEITWTYVDPALYRRGVARAMLQHVMARASAPLELEVLDGNEVARAAYESVGFVVILTSTGKLAGNETFAATGHMMRWEPDRGSRAHVALETSEQHLPPSPSANPAEPLASSATSSELDRDLP